LFEFLADIILVLIIFLTSLTKPLLALFAQSTPWKIGAGGRGHEGGGLDRGN
jgi:hypothetical protein